MNHTFPYQCIDLTHTLTPDSPSWSGGCGFHPAIKLDYKDCSTEVSFRVQQIKMHAGIGTHIDSPSHCIPGGNTVESIPLTSLLAPLVIIDVHQTITDHDRVSIQDINHFESKQGRIEAGSFVAFYTGWSQYWSNPERYRNNHVFPSVDAATAELLVSRGIVGIGIDTLSPDVPSSGFPVHHIILGANKYIVENLNNLDKVPITGAYALILPLKGEGLTEAPTRVVGLIEK